MKVGDIAVTKYGLKLRVSKIFGRRHRGVLGVSMVPECVHFEREDGRSVGHVCRSDKGLVDVYRYINGEPMHQWESCVDWSVVSMNPTALVDCFPKM